MVHVHIKRHGTVDQVRHRRDDHPQGRDKAAPSLEPRCAA